MAGDLDVLLEQVSELHPGWFTIEGNDRIAEMLLVLEQPRGGSPSVRRVARERDDILAGPDGVVGPQPSQIGS